MRIKKRVFFKVLNALRNEDQISVNHPSFSDNQFESSHIVGLLEKALFIETTHKNPIHIKSKKNWHSKINENIWNDFRNKFPAGTEFQTPIKGARNTISKWKVDQVIYYPNKSLIRNISKEDFTSISNIKLNNKLDSISETEKTSIINSRIGQDVLRELIIEAYDNSCAMCGINDPKLLRASHIIKWSMNKKNRLNPNNVLCLCGLHDLAFENGIIIVSDNYEILINSKSKKVLSLLKKITFKKLNLPSNKNFLPDNNLLKGHRSFFKP